MSYISLETLIQARSYIDSHVRKADTFAGLFIFLTCICNSERNGTYLKSDMKKFSEYADKAFYLSSDESVYSEKYWYALLTIDWVDQVKNSFLNGEKISLKGLVYSLFWYKTEQEINEILQKIPSSVITKLFISDINSEDFVNVDPIDRVDLASSYSAIDNSGSIKFDNSFIKKRAGDLSGAPFGQTLYAGKEIKKTISVYDFDFMSLYNLYQKDPIIRSNIIISEKFIAAFIHKLLDFLIEENIEEIFFNHLVPDAKNPARHSIEFEDKRLAFVFLSSDKYLTEDELKKEDKVLRFVKEPIQIDSKLYYLSNQWTDGTDSPLDIQRLMKVFNALYDNYKIVKRDGLYMLIEPLLSRLDSRENETSLSKPFLLLAGISGTGKTRFVREQAKATGSISDTYCLTSVRPDWHEPSDILGYTSRLGGDGNANYITTDVLQFIAKAWRAIIDSGLELEPEGNGLAVIGNKNELNQVLPYWLCLDEMNLAPVEQYFADYLSVLETREWQWDDEHFTYCCDSLLKSETIKQLGDKSKLREALGFTGEQYDDAWNLFCEHGLGLPFNLIVAGTVNMDETTHGFSRKVIDRALSFDFGDFFPNEFDNFFEPKVTHNALSYPIDSQASIDKLPPIDRDGSKSISFLKSINKVLDDTPFQLAFRALNELLLAVISAYPEDEKQLQAVWDDFLMCKVLPRIEGDHDKLAVISDSVSSHEESLLTELTAILKQELIDIWSIEDDPDKLRPDLYRKNIDGSFLYIACRSKAKLTWMQQRLERSGFTSFWP
ncbi:McrB family protein [Psychrobacter sp.]|uniref:McrB family protein n=1 Tax=Psychrobacter sp. TaxID=56811 RepID=UPI003F9B0FB5